MRKRIFIALVFACLCIHLLLNSVSGEDEDEENEDEEGEDDEGEDDAKEVI